MCEEFMTWTGAGSVPVKNLLCELYWSLSLLVEGAIRGKGSCNLKLRAKEDAQKSIQHPQSRETPKCFKITVPKAFLLKYSS